MEDVEEEGYCWERLGHKVYKLSSGMNLENVALALQSLPGQFLFSSSSKAPGAVYPGDNPAFVTSEDIPRPLSNLGHSSMKLVVFLIRV